MWVIRILTDRGTEYRGKLETHDYRLCPGVNGIEHARTRARHPQATGICQRFHKTIPHEFCQVAFRRNLYPSLEDPQSDPDIWLEYCNTERTHQGKMCRGGTPMQTLPDGKKLWNERSDSLTRRTGTTSKRRELSDQV